MGGRKLDPICEQVSLQRKPITTQPFSRAQRDRQGTLADHVRTGWQVLKGGCVRLWLGMEGEYGGYGTEGFPCILRALGVVLNIVR